MNTNRPDELLSAFFDDEASLEERTAVERRLHASQDARRKLQEIEQISGLLQSLPRESAPEEFSAAVLKRAEQQLLLEEQPTATPVLSPFSRRWLVRIASLAAAAVILVIAQQFFHRATDGIDVAQNGEQLARVSDQPSLGSNETDSRFAANARNSRLATIDADGATAGLRKLAEAAAEDHRRKRPRDTQSARLEGLVTSSPDDQKRDSNRTFGLAGTPADHLTGETFEDVLRSARVSNGRVAVVELTVADVRTAVREVQKLLSTTETLAKDESRDNPASLQSENSADELSALYVETSDEKLAATLVELHRKHLVLALRTKPAIDLNRIEVTFEEGSSATPAFAGKQQLAEKLTLAKSIERGKQTWINNKSLDRLRRRSVVPAPLLDKLKGRGGGSASTARNQSGAAKKSVPTDSTENEEEDRARTGEKAPVVAPKPGQINPHDSMATSFYFWMKLPPKAFKSQLDSIEQDAAKPEGQKRPAAVSTKPVGSDRPSAAKRPAPARVIFLFRAVADERPSK